MRRLVCPYCFETILSAKRAYRCVNTDGSRCPPEKDMALGQYLRRSEGPLLPRVFVVPSRISPVCRCGSKGKPVCPHCHSDLPGEFGEIPSKTIALIGAKEVGKSNYIAVLLHELTNRIGERFNASINALDEQTRRRYNEQFRSYIYDRREVVPATRSARAEIEVRYPLVYRLSLQRRRFLFGNSLRVMSLVFFDTAGEDLTHVDLMSTETRYLANSDGIVFLLDPLQIRAVRDRLAGTMSLPSESSDPSDIIGRVVQLVRQMRSLGPTARIDTPVALAFSKIDAIRSLVEPGSPVHQASNHDGYFDLADAERLNESMRAYVTEWVGGGLHTFLKHNFETFAYFGLSALGSSPDGQGRLPMGAAPFRVEDPFLWVLHHHRIIPGRRRS